MPEQEEEAARVMKLARRYRARGAELETEVNPYGMSALSKWVPVPPVPMRAQLMREMHEALGHAGRDKLAEIMLS